MLSTPHAACFVAIRCANNLQTAPHSVQVNCRPPPRPLTKNIIWEAALVARQWALNFHELCVLRALHQLDKDRRLDQGDTQPSCVHILVLLLM